MINKPRPWNWLLHLKGGEEQVDWGWGIDIVSHTRHQGRASSGSCRKPPGCSFELYHFFVKVERIVVRKKERASHLIASQKVFFFPTLEGHLVIVVGK